MARGADRLPGSKRLLPPPRGPLNALSVLSTMLLKFLGWLLTRFIAGALVAILLLAGVGWWRYHRDPGDFVRRRSEQLAGLKARQDQIKASLENVRKKREETSAEIDAEEARAAQADRVIVTLRELSSTWDRYVGNPAQQKANDEQIKHMETLREGARSKQTELKQGRTRLVWERDGLEIAQQQVEAQIAGVDESQSALAFYLSDTWDRAQGGYLIFLGVYFFALLVFAPRPRAEAD
jgi:endonuclease/exonuclease/phosphatase (EEP) superfamily protein YafD